jgi:hypothetical protein
LVIVNPIKSFLLAVVRANAWLSDLANNRYTSIEKLASAVQLHPKVIRQGLRLAFLAPLTTKAILDGTQPAHLTLAAIPKALPLAWWAQLLRTS